MRRINSVGGAVPRVPKGTLIMPHNPQCLDTLWGDALDIQRKCKDVIIEDSGNSNRFCFSWYVNSNGDFVKSLDFVPDDVITLGTPVDDNYCDEVHRAYLTKWSFGQLCNKAGVPTRYMDKCINSGLQHLVPANINDFLIFQNKKLLIRLYNDEVRGILGSKYVTLDTPDIIQVVAQSQFLSGANIKGYVLDPTRLHLRLVMNEPLTVQGEDLFPGVAITSSDVGKSSLRVQFFVYKEVCTNGLMLPISQSLVFEPKHIGIAIDEFARDLKDNLSQCSKYASNVSERIGKLKFEQGLSRKELSHLLKMGADKTLFSEQAIEEVLDLSYCNYSPTQWGLINAITQYAQRFTIERRVQFEEFAGNLLYRDI